MAKQKTLSRGEIEELDRFYRQGGLRQMGSPHVHYQDPECPHPDCNHQMEWIDFQPKLHREPDTIYKPLVRAWWKGTGFAGRCAACHQWIHFTTLSMKPLSEQEAASLPKLPDEWHTVAQFA